MSHCRTAIKTVRPLMSTDFCEARTRALGLYKAIYRFIPYLVRMYDIPKNEEDCRWKLREYFYKNAYVTDLRVIDLLVMKGYMELKELTQKWASKSHVMAYWNPTWEPKPTNFMGKFLHGLD